MTIASHRHQARFGRLRGLTLALAMAGLVGGCSVAATSPSPSTGVLSSFSPGAAATTPTASPTTPAPVASIGTAPAGAWSGLKWISAGSAFPQTPVPTTADGSVEVSVFGWSGGYVGFRTAFDLNSSGQAPPFVMVSTSSADGVHWTAGRPMATEWAKDVVDITQVIQGPSGLLAVGHYGRAACGGPSTVDALWTSPDGLIWTHVTPPADFTSSSVYTIDGGSIGYIASGMLRDGVTQAIWLSADGISWHQTATPKPTTGTLVVDGATSFASGYVVAGAVLGDEGCGGPSLTTPSLWWSATGSSWTRIKLTGATPANDATMAVTRISDHCVMAIATEWGAPPKQEPLGAARMLIATPAQLVWVSTDGQSWQLVKSPSSLLGGRVVSNGQRGLVVAEPPNNEGPPTVATVGDDLTVITLTQAGDGPVASASSTLWMPAALGPTGVVMLSSDGLNLWLGVPTAS